MAVKQLKQHDARNDIRFLREIAILKECRSGHVVQFLVRLPPATAPLLGLSQLVSATCALHQCQVTSSHGVSRAPSCWEGSGGMRFARSTPDCLQRHMRKHGIRRAGACVQGACVAPGSTMLVCELMEGGSVHNRLRAGQLAWPDGSAPSPPPLRMPPPA